MKPALLASIVVMLVVSGVARAEDEDVPIYPPKGWTVTKLPDGSANVQAPGVPVGKTCAFVVLPDSEGELTHQFDKSLRRITARGRVTIKEDTSGSHPGGSQMRLITGVVEAQGVTPTHISFGMIQSGSRLRAVLFAADDEGLFDKHRDAVLEMMATAHTVASAVTLERAAAARAAAKRAAPRRPTSAAGEEASAPTTRPRPSTQPGSGMRNVAKDGAA